MNANNATHWLSCTHSLNSRSKIYYRMPCHVVKTMVDGRKKILVFGNRYWKDEEHRSRVRYVAPHRLTPRKEI